MVQNLNNYQIEQANLAFENALIDAYQKYGGQGFLEALVDPDAASDEDICLSMMLTMQVAHDMEGITGKWMRAMFFLGKSNVRKTLVKRQEVTRHLSIIQNQFSEQCQELI